MIAFVKGILEEITPEYAVVDVNGVGYYVYVPAGIAEDRERFFHGARVCLYTSMQVREDDMSLYGFADAADKRLFEQLLGVNGIGPKAALAILSFMNADQLRYAILIDDAKAIAKTPGVGLKTAQKLILDLKDKISSDDLLDGDSAAAGGTAVKAAAGRLGDEAVVNEAIQALEALGFAHMDAVKAVQSAVALAGEKPDAEQLLKLALKQIM